MPSTAEAEEAAGVAEGPSAPEEAASTSLACIGGVTGPFAFARGCGGWLGRAEEGGSSRLAADEVLPVVSAFPGNLIGNGCPEDDAGDRGSLCLELGVFTRGKPAEGFVFAFRGESFDGEAAPFCVADVRGGDVVWGEAG